MATVNDDGMNATEEDNKGVLRRRDKTSGPDNEKKKRISPFCVTGGILNHGMNYILWIY